MLIALLTLCSALSGFAAMLYQTAWLQLFALVLGTSHIAVVVVLAGYMGGLAFGAFAAKRVVDRIRRPVLVYALLELLIGLSALLLPYLLNLIGNLYIWAAGNQPLPPDANTIDQTIFYSVSAFLLLLVPTALMGATLPLLARFAVTSISNLSPRISILYSLNTAGAAAGALVAGFVLLPDLGLRATAGVGVAINFAAFGLAVAVSLFAPKLERVSARLNDNTNRTPTASFILPLIALSGSATFIYEILWMRMLSHVLGSSLYSFSTMLASFLTGIALGAMCVGSLARSPRSAILLFASCQFAVAIASGFVYTYLEKAVPTAANQVALAFAVMLPSTIFIGATYPLAVRATTALARQAGSTSARVYTWNTVGAILGAVGGSAYIIPEFGFSGTAKLAVSANALIGLATMVLAGRPTSCFSIPRWQVSTAFCAAIFTVVLFRPGIPHELVSRDFFGGSESTIRRQQYFAVGRSSTVYLAETKSGFSLSTNGLPEAQIDFRGAPPTRNSQRWLGIWPSLLRPATNSMLVIGLGGGVVLESIPDTVRAVHVIELENEVVRSNLSISDRRNFDPLSDTRVKVIVNDARNALRLTNMKYDAIVSQPSHPWASGAAPLFSQQFFALVRQHLNHDGVFVQWINAEFVDEELLRRLAATVAAEFHHVRIYQPSALALHFVASNEPIPADLSFTQSGTVAGTWPTHLTRNGITSKIDINATLLVDEYGLRRFIDNLTPITDDRNSMALASNHSGNGLSLRELSQIVAPYDPLLDENSLLRQSLDDKDLVLLGWRIVQDRQFKRTANLLGTIGTESVRKLLRAIVLRQLGAHQQAMAELKEITEESPVFDAAVFLRVVDRLPLIATGDLSSQSLPDLGLRESNLMTVFKGWRFLAEENWVELADLDTVLGEISSAELWSPYAAELMAEWRIRESDPSGHLAAEALYFVDRAIAMHPRAEAFFQRARIGLKLNDDSILTESVALAVQDVQKRLSLASSPNWNSCAAASRATVRWLDFFARELRIASVDATTDRAAIVLEDVENLAKQISNFDTKTIDYQSCT